MGGVVVLRVTVEASLLLTEKASIPFRGRDSIVTQDLT